MSKESIVKRIISDGEQEEMKILSEAERKAAEICDGARERAQRRFTGVKAETAQKVKSILDGRQAAARLDGAKAELAEKRRVIDEVYKTALKKLCALDKEDALKLAERLLKSYAEEGDEIAFSSDYKYSQDCAKLDIVKKKKLKISHKNAKVEGGFILLGKNCDKDLSYRALLEEDREFFQAEIASEIFKD